MSMISPNKQKEVVLIVGPTASGKSALALELAKKQALQNRQSVIINADSAQVYRDLQILSARPTESEMEGVPHKLYGYINGAEACSAARWANDAKTAITSAHEKDHLPILVGGTGLYIRTLLNGIAPIPEIDPEIRAEIRAMETMEAQTALLAEDPISAKRLNPTDTSRIMRALEVVRSTGHPLDYWHQHMTGGIASDILLKPLILLPPRDWLYGRCDLRFEIMMNGGATDEVRHLLSLNLRNDCPVMRAIGVRDIAAMLRDEIDRDTAISNAQMATRRYAKRQYTWFRNQSPPEWKRLEEILNNDIINNIETILQY
ncbi:tRNA (adenosine(37)-N6)-dimethylallyltransferase MiaA [Parasphingorhabdus halotolerans]|uniref:tRNA dimethylallyltransferase n=2 Tax=Parasphingorhabdus halotolerans TaxID=2725558 RepID=A0A6H2DKU4_9SPHN|nr:tRNA (adenosine(37)-N6)-dimethylallyltransferase MiaA [Parasphingorhabdus halotolerans]